MPESGTGEKIGGECVPKTVAPPTKQRLLLHREDPCCIATRLGYAFYLTIVYGANYDTLLEPNVDSQASLW